MFEPTAWDRCLWRLTQAVSADRDSSLIMINNRKIRSHWIQLAGLANTCRLVFESLDRAQCAVGRGCSPEKVVAHSRALIELGLLQANRVALSGGDHVTRAKLRTIPIENIEDFANQAGHVLVNLANYGADPGEAMPLVVMIVDAMGSPDALSDALDRISRC